MSVDQAPPAQGTVRVANEVIATIAAMAAREVEGVAGMDDPSARHLGDWLKRQTAHDGVRVVIDATKTIHLELFLCVAASAHIGEVAEQVQANVVEAVERMLGLEVAEVNVFVSSIAFSA
ncbi:MAG TPA: Asp23/Gls24 family envelope stress response protein [Candidatus Dormibacteraeota bacterium]